MATVLLVDDHPDLREVVGELLQMHGHEVLYSPSAENGLEQARRHHPDAIIVDHRLPGITGLEFLEAMRSDPVLKIIPVVICSADDSQREAARSAGADDFWLKGSEKLFEGVALLGQKLSDGTLKRPA